VSFAVAGGGPRGGPRRRSAAAAALAWRSNSAVPPRVSLTSRALRSVITRMSRSWPSSRAAASEWSRFAWVIALMCLAVLVVAAVMSCTARDCSFNAREACSDSRRIEAIALAIWVTVVVCSPIAWLTFAMFRANDSAALVI
jgi:heme/copper-type cytochrome/quinol oxidase subunit 2